MRKLAKRPDPKPAPAPKADAAPDVAVASPPTTVSARDEELAADRMAALVMRRAYTAEAPAASARSRPPTDVGRIRRATKPGIEQEAEEESEEIVSRAPLSLASTGPLPVVDDAEEASEEVEVEELLDPSVFKIRAMYTRLTEVGVPEDEVGEVLDLYATHLAKGGSDEEFLEWVRSHYLASVRGRRSGGGKGSSKKQSEKKTDDKAKGNGKGSGKPAGKAAGAASSKPATKASKPASGGKVTARNETKSGT